MQTHIIKFIDKEDAKAVKWVNLARSKDQTKPMLNTIRIDNETLVACDGYRLNRIETPEILQEYNQKSLKPLTNIPINSQPVEFEEIEGTYPEWKEIEKLSDGKEIVFQIAVNKKLLADLSNMPSNSNNMIVLKFTAKHEPIRISAPGTYYKAEALIMPMDYRD